ncbi:hypothetical protein GQ457_14G024000 [Hibiscus cannabinus]
MSGFPTLAHGTTTSKEVVNPGGRPPDGLPSITGDTVRERAASSSALDNLRSSKKGRLDSVDHMEANSSAMEADECNPHSFLKDEVLIREEDIIKDCSGKIPSIQFSARVHDQIDNNLRNAIIVRLLGRAIVEEAEPIHDSAQVNGVNESAGNPVRGKQVIRNFGQERMVNTNAAYKRSSPEKKKKTSKSMPPVSVVPGSNSATVQVTEHIRGISHGEHRAVRINEQESSRRSLQVRRDCGARVTEHVSASEFVNRVTSELHSFERRDKASSSGGPAAHGASSPMLQSSDDEDFYRSDSAEILPEGALFADDQ